MTSAKNIKPSRRAQRYAPKIRASIQPGSVLILLAGPHKGKRVIFLKQLKSGLLLVTGPYKINGVPLRRVNQAYVIATSTRIDISSVEIPATLKEAHFQKKKEFIKVKKTIDEFYKQKQAKPTVLPEERKAAQGAVDKALIPLIKKVPMLSHYLSSKFSLSKGSKPHLMRF